jgi:hypothetical protein
MGVFIFSFCDTTFLKHSSSVGAAALRLASCNPHLSASKLLSLRLEDAQLSWHEGTFVIG